MDYKVMKRPMFKMGGPTSGGTGITSGLETPRQNFRYGTYDEAVQAIPGMFEKTMTGLENRRSTIGPMALLQAAASGAFNDVDSIGSLAMAAGTPQFLGAGFQGLEQNQKLDTQIDALGLKEATTMATLLKPGKTGDNQAVYDKKVLRLGVLEDVISKLDTQAETLDPNDPNYEKDLLANRKEKRRATTEITTTISSSYLTDETLIRRIEKDYYSQNGSYPSPKTIAKELKKAKARYAIAGLAQGGRINKAMGGGMDMGQEQPMQAAQTMAPGPEMMPQGGGQDMGEDPFTILRQRLPQEISDEVVSLIAYNKIAFQDFANIQDQDDVDLFNQKYNVQLVVDMASR